MAKVIHRADAGLRIDGYIQELPLWSKEICNKLRKIILSTSTKIVEDWKWGPNYYYEGMICGFGAFKNHCTLVFFYGASLSDPQKILDANSSNIQIRHIKFTSPKEINATVLKAYIKVAMKNNEEGLRILPPKDKTITLHDDFVKALNKAKLRLKFEGYTFYKQKEISEWISAAKQDTTRISRIEKAIEMILVGKSLNDKYR
ncbi:MAG: DUF1801 domain-containing protein [Bacteroidetes bacterium]|nr:DUF1801 domain-containing protein [Bacteroidota bacterium]